MARPIKPRRIRKYPASNIYRPVKSSKAREVCEIGWDEFEALRLTDVEQLSQAEVAKMMNISRQSIQLMLQQARYKLTGALSKGQSIRIGGGSVQIHHCPYICNDCGHSFQVAATETEKLCPHCGSNATQCVSEEYCARFCRQAQTEE